MGPVCAMHEPMTMTTKAVILARGLGSRMRKADDDAALDAAQAAAADSGVKGMIPIGRPFMDFLISALADAGFTDVCLVIGPEHQVVRDYYEDVAPVRVRIAFAVQERPAGTADAVLAAEQFADGAPFVVINSDNYYPVHALAELHRRSTPALIAFDRDALVSMGNVAEGTVPRFGALEIDRHGALRRIVATPHPVVPGETIYASLNCWLFTSEIFRACRAVTPSARGELELPQAVQLAIARGWMRFDAIRLRAGVLDMSSRGDVASVAERLRGTRVVI
ncbi:sugar phosphate nucleotidyltransferase [soil metagenome]